MDTGADPLRVAVVCLCVKLCKWLPCILLKLVVHGMAFERSINFRCEWRTWRWDGVARACGTTVWWCHQLLQRGGDAREVPRMNGTSNSLGASITLLAPPPLSLYMHTPSFTSSSSFADCHRRCLLMHSFWRWRHNEHESHSHLQHDEQIGQKSIISGNQLLKLWVWSSVLLLNCSGMCQKKRYFRMLMT